MHKMAEYFAQFAPEELPDISYSRVDAEQAACMLKAMELPDNQANFELTLLPIDTSEQRQAVAEEWAGYEQAKNQIKARDRGAFLVVDGRDRSPEYYRNLLEDKDEARMIPFAPFVTHAVSKIIKLSPDSHVYDLLKEYYEPTE